jgi:hypothetical protein
MKGMEGGADANNDNKITARELHAYVKQNVVQQSSGSQTPELQGNKVECLYSLIRDNLTTYVHLEVVNVHNHFYSYILH